MRVSPNDSFKINLSSAAISSFFKDFSFFISSVAFSFFFSSMGALSEKWALNLGSGFSPTKIQRLKS
jgi:hypothetical protein